MELLQRVLALRPGMEKAEVLLTMGHPNSEHQTVNSKSVLCYTSDSLSRSKGDCGPVAIALDSNQKITKIFIAGPDSRIIE